MACQCNVGAWEDVKLCGIWFQHGDNPEARVFISYLRFTKLRHVDAIISRFLRRWELRIHTADLTPTPPAPAEETP